MGISRSDRTLEERVAENQETKAAKKRAALLKTKREREAARRAKDKVSRGTEKGRREDSRVLR